jgi:hypothetical protein
MLFISKTGVNRMDFAAHSCCEVGMILKKHSEAGSAGILPASSGEYSGRLGRSSLQSCASAIGLSRCFPTALPPGVEKKDEIFRSRAKIFLDITEGHLIQSARFS